MFEILYSRKTNCAINYWLLFVLCFSFVALSNQLNNTSSSPSTLMTDGTPSDYTAYASHKLPCTEEERQRVGCLNGDCFAVDLNPRVAGCACHPGWEGDRCQLMEMPPEIWEASSLVGLVGFIVGLVACAVVVGFGFLIFFIWKRRKHSVVLNADQNGNGEEEEAALSKPETNGSRTDEQPSSS